MTSRRDMEKPDAGLQGLDHYKSRLPWWRYVPRQWLIPLVRWETPYLALVQSAMRTPTLDSYFAATANLGTHTFFMIFLPILFWCGYTSIARALTHLLASGVFFSGFFKDLLCLPRPLSPPLQRITMSGSAALEYGFPSTHSTNAVSVAAYAVLALHSPASTVPSAVRLTLQTLAYTYAVSIVVGRIYCGMHGFLDVVVGSLLGAALSIVQFSYVDKYSDFIHADSAKALFIVILAILVLVRIHPEPADDCPCFDDSVAFAGVICGIEAGNWHFARSPHSWDLPVRATVPFDLQVLGWPKTILRILVGVLCVFAWRATMKSALLKGLPPVFRVFERLGLSLPRKFFKRATEYDQVPEHLKTDNVMPSVSGIPSFISSIRHPGRSRSVSIGPQSAADAYEVLASRQKRREETQISAIATSSDMKDERLRTSEVSDYLGAKELPSRGLLPTPFSSSTNLEGELLIPGLTFHNPLTPSDSTLDIPSLPRTPSQNRRDNEKEEKEVFSQISKLRVRYDVEVITKLVLYSGIGWIAVEGAPIMFRHLGLGLDRSHHP